jgi:putative membrane protein
MTPKLYLLTLTASLALVACSNDTMSQRDVGNPDTSGSGSFTNDQTGTSGRWNNTSNSNKYKSMTNVAVRDDTLSEADKAFIREAGSGGLFEVDSGQKAVDKATDNQVKTIGQRMIDDHTRLNKELTDFASSKGYNETPTISGKENGMLERLDKANGADFDREYIKIGLDDHRKDLAKFEHEASSAHDRDLRNWAGQTVPTLREHLTMFEDRARAMGLEKSMGMEKTGDMKNSMGTGNEHRPGFYPGQSAPTGVDIQPSNPNSDGNANR